MNKLTTWIICHFGKAGFYFYCLLIGVANLLPMIILDFPMWLYLLISAILWFIPLAQFPYLGVWIWAFVVCLGRPVTWLSALFYVSFALYFGNILLSFFKKDNSGY